MSRISMICGLGLVWATVAGCHDSTPPPPRGPIPPVGSYTPDGRVPPKPLPGHVDAHGALPAPFDDVPLLTQPLPEQAAFVASYGRVGSPTMALFVNRTIDGQPIIRDERRPDDNAPIDRIDYDAVELVMTDWLAAGGKLTIISPRLSETQSRDLTRENRPNVLQGLSREGGVDVLVHVQAKLTQHYGNQTGVRLLAEAVNTRGGESLARAFIDMPPVMDKPIINDRTRYLVRKLMLDMTRYWENAPVPPPAPAPAPAMPPTTMPQ